MNNNILRTGKVKTRMDITQAVEHILRLRMQANIDASKSNQNCVLVNSLNADLDKASSLQEKLSEHYDSLGIKEKQDNVLMMEFIVSASPEFFEKMEPSKIKEWAEHQVKFFKSEFGEQLKIAVLHLDEKTPHLHFMIGTELESVKKYKNQKGEFFKKSWSLNAKRYDPQFLVGLHDRHANWNKKYKLQRGVKGSLRRHKSLKEFYKVVDKALNADYSNKIESVIDSLETTFLSKKVSVQEVRNKFKPVINSLLKQNKALKEKVAVDIKKWATDLSDVQAKLKLEREELKQKREVYADAINRVSVDTKLIQELNTENKYLKNELRKYKPKEVEPINGNQFSPEFPGFKKPKI